MRANSRGARSQRTTSARGSSSTRLDVTISPPSDERRAASASTSACDAAAGEGPAVDVRGGAERRGRSPALPARSSGSTEWAACPAKNARARSVSNSRATARALRRPRMSEGRRRNEIPARPPLRPRADERLDEGAVRLRVGAEPVRGVLAACARARRRRRRAREPPGTADRPSRRRARRTRASSARAAGSPRRRRGGSPAASARRCGSRRRSSPPPRAR